MADFAILVSFRVKAGQAAAFRRLLLENAATSVRDEPGCLRFDLLDPQDDSAGELVTLYEIYADAAAFEAHLRSPHFAQFKAATTEMLETSRIERFRLTEHAKGLGAGEGTP